MATRRRRARSRTIWFGSGTRRRSTSSPSHSAERQARCATNGRDLLVIVVEDLEAVVAPVAQRVGGAPGRPRLAVHALAEEDAEVARAVVMRSSTERISLHMKSTRCTRKIASRGPAVQVVQRRLGGKQVEGVQPQAEIRHVGAADHLPGQS